MQLPNALRARGFSLAFLTAFGRPRRWSHGTVWHNFSTRRGNFGVDLIICETTTS
jgi:hypothetical protein